MLGEPDPVPTPDNSFFPGASALKNAIFSPNFRKSFFQTVGEKRAAKMSGKNIGVHKSKPGEKAEVFAARYKKENDPLKPRFPFRTVTKRKPSKGGGLITPFSRSRNMNEGTHTVSVSLDPNGAGYIYGNSGHNAFSFNSEKPSGELRSLVSDHDHGHLHIQQITKVHTNKNRELLNNKNKLMEDIRTVRSSHVPTKDVVSGNLGHKAENDLIQSTPHFEKSSKSSGRGADTHVTHKSGNRLSVEIKSKGSAKGQTQFSRSARGKWGYHKGDTFATALNDHMGSKNARRHLHGTYGTPKGDSNAHVKKTHEKRGGELHLKLGGSTEEIAKVIHGGMNHNDIYHDTDKGSYALTDKASKITGLPHIRDHIDSEAASKGDVISVRHRVKTHSSPKEGKSGVYSTTAQLNINHKHLTPSTHDITKMSNDYKKLKTEAMNEGAPEGAPIKDKNKIGASVAAAVKKLMKPGYEDPDTPTASPPARSSGGY